MKIQRTNDKKVELFKIFASKDYKLSLGLTTVDSVCAHFGMSTATYYDYKKQWQNNGGKPDKPDYDSDEYLVSKMKEVDEALVVACKSGNAQALKTYLVRLDKYIEKSEGVINYAFTPGDYIRIARETVDGLREEYQRTGGICPVCKRPQVFLDETCVDNQQEHGEDSQVETLAVST